VSEIWTLYQKSKTLLSEPGIGSHRFYDPNATLPLTCINTLLLLIPAAFDLHHGWRTKKGQCGRHT